MTDVVDSTGRKIAVTALDPADMLDLLEAAGDASANSGYMRYAMVICSVSNIDGVPVPRPTKKNEIKALAKRLGNEGFAAVTKSLFGDDNAAKDDADTAKN